MTTEQPQASGRETAAATPGSSTGAGTTPVPDSDGTAAGATLPGAGPSGLRPSAPRASGGWFRRRSDADAAGPADEEAGGRTDPATPHGAAPTGEPTRDVDLGSGRGTTGAGATGTLVRSATPPAVTHSAAGGVIPPEGAGTGGDGGLPVAGGPAAAGLSTGLGAPPVMAPGGTAGAGTAGAGTAGAGTAGAGTIGAGTAGAGTIGTGLAGASAEAARAAGAADTAQAKRGFTTVRPPGSPPDPWTAFASTAERRPGRIRRAVRATGRAVFHEYTLVLLGSIAVAVLMTWPTLRYPLHTIPQDTWNPAMQAWQLAWSGHILLTDPLQLWQSNAFLGERYSFAFSDSMLGYAPFGMIGSGPTAAILRYNIIFVAAHALLLLGGYALVRQLGAGRTGAAVAGMAFAFAPWRLAQEGQLHLVSVGAIPLALAMLARGHGWSLRYGLRPERRHAGWAFAGWLVAAWQLSLGLTIGIPFAYVMAIIVILAALGTLVRRIRRIPGPKPSRRQRAADLIGLLLFGGVGAVLVLPHIAMTTIYPNAVPTEAQIRFFSPPLRSLLIGPPESRIWGGAHAVARGSLDLYPEMTLLPGFTLYALALVGLVFSVWKVRHRLLLLVGVLVTGVLTSGTQFYGGRWTYLPLVDFLPGWEWLRTPGRLMLWTTLLLAVLAAGAVSELVRRAEYMSSQRVPPWPGPWLRLATLVPLLLVMVEGLNVTHHPVVPAQPAAMRTIGGPTLVLPTAALGDQHVQLWSTSRFQPIANGTGTFVPPLQDELRRSSATFPDAASIGYLRGRGITTVVLLRDRITGTPWERAGDVPVDTLGIQREDLDDAVVFRL